ncbi:hypothetical protein FRX31_005031 [Thalictrum thalictroides]|uniref:Transmembrane protein n=1 Tax=Thalictrum thalictroides TaxID=46969 RepID=A0A7J6X905_THATH|nr:hypothetical protein FRX31_005031 [Thalictrum thalictroides]
MASLPHPSQSRHLSFCFIFLVLLFILPWSCSSTRSGGTMIVDVDQNSKVLHQEKLGVRYETWVFNYFPKGKQIPPSGPSKRHNNFVNSIPQN